MRAPLLRRCLACLALRRLALTYVVFALPWCFGVVFCPPWRVGGLLAPGGRIMFRWDKPVGWVAGTLLRQARKEEMAEDAVVEWCVRSLSANATERPLFAQKTTAWPR